MAEKRGGNSERIAAVEMLRDAASSGARTRRQVLRRAGALGLSAGSVAALLDACGGSSIGPTATPTPAAPNASPPQSAATGVSATSRAASAPAPVVSGPIRVGMTGDGKSLDPAD